MTARTPLVGFNDNVEHQGQTYHVQTEDSAGRRCNVITHLFADGGRIVTSSKSSYKEFAEEPNADERVRELMREQHRAMLVALQSGQLDAMLASAAPPAPPDAAGAPRPRAAGQTLSMEEVSLDTVRAARRGATPRVPVAGLPSSMGGATGSGPTPPAELSPEASPAAGAPLVVRPAAATPTSLGSPASTTSGGRPAGPQAEAGSPERAVGAASRAPSTAPRPGGGSRADRAPSVPDIAARRPTPATGGAYRFVGGGAAPLSPSQAEGMPPRRRRYPQTNPGRLRPISESGPTVAGSAVSVAVPKFPSTEPFGARTPMTLRLDELIIELLAELRSS